MQRGGFFRALNFYRQTDVFSGGLDSTELTSAPPTPLYGSSWDFGHVHDQQTKDALAAYLFLDKLNLGLLERLWVAIKKHCMDAMKEKHSVDGAAGRSQGVYEAIKKKDFLNLTFQEMQRHSEDDEQILIRLFDCVDRRKKGSVRTTDIATALVLICNADPIPRQRDGLSKLKTMFRIFDADDDSCLTPDEIFDMYVSIKANDVTKTRQAVVADITFDDELSVHEAKRLYEQTIELLNVSSDFIIFEEFKKVFDERPDLINQLLPGAFTLEWILSEYKLPSQDRLSSAVREFGSDVKRGLLDAMRRGEEHLDLSKKRGRGMRIMENCLNIASHRPVSEEERSPLIDDNLDGDGAGGASGSDATACPNSARCLDRASRASLPKISSASKSARTPRRSSSNKVPAMGACNAHGGKDGTGATEASLEKRRLEEEDEDLDDDDTDEDEAAAAYGTARGDARGSVHHSVSASAGHSHSHPGSNTVGIGKSVLPQEALELPQLEVLPLNHTHAMRFRTMTLDAKTQQAYLRDKKDVNRSLRYQCLVCAVNHDFRLSKCAATAEHLHA